jgi:hypothetical protein
LRLPRLGRALAVLLVMAASAALAVLINGPWLRVAQVDLQGARYTSLRVLERIVEPVRGASLLALDGASLVASLRSLPSLADARVRVILPHRVEVELIEKPAAFVWQTSAVRLIGASDGTIIGQLARTAALPAGLQGLPGVDDQRRASRNIIVGDVIDPEILASAQRLWQVDPIALGSTATRVDLAIDDEHGFVLVSRPPAWRAAVGFYGLDPIDAPAEVDARIEAQLAAVRTLFAGQPESGISWIDARNPGRVYWLP